MRLPSMKYSSRLVKSKQIKFGGLAHYEGAQDGELWDMQNLTSDYYPLLAPRRPRPKYQSLKNASGLCSREKLCWTAGTEFFYGGKRKGSVSSGGNKTFAALGAYIIIMPDKCWYNTDTDEYGLIESTWNGEKLVFQKGEGSNGSTIWVEGVDWLKYFRVGDTVSISGCTIMPGNNKSITIRDIDGDKLFFGEDSFSGKGDWASYSESGSLEIKRRMPDLKFLCEHENRLWGCTDSTIYACKSGDIFNWYTYDGLADDAWSLMPGSEGAFTGCTSYGGYAVFFKENQICKIYGSLPSDFQLLSSATMGLAKGSEKSLAVAGETLFYLNRNGIMAYTGGIPQPISEAFGTDRFEDAVAGSDGLKYYVSMKSPDGWGLYVYDTQRGLWHREDDKQIVQFAQCDGNLYMLDASGDIWIAGNGIYSEQLTLEDPVEWTAEFADFTDKEPNHKGICKLQLRLELDADSTCLVWIQYDSSGKWQRVSLMEGEGRKRSCVVPLIPQRADHYRLKITGTGPCRIHSLTREYYVGSEIRH